MSKSKGEDDVAFPKECFSVSFIGLRSRGGCLLPPVTSATAGPSTTRVSLCHRRSIKCGVLTNLRHSWLFPQLDAVLHHGGAGTTGESARYGVLSALIFSWMVTNPNSWHSHTDSSVVRVSSSSFGLHNCADEPHTTGTCRDQFFWASRVQKLGVNFVSLRHLGVMVLIANLLCNRPV